MAVIDRQLKDLTPFTKHFKHHIELIHNIKMDKLKITEVAQQIINEKFIRYIPQQLKQPLAHQELRTTKLPKYN